MTKFNFQITSVDPSTRLEILDTADIPDSNDKVVSVFFVGEYSSQRCRLGLSLGRVQISRN